MIRQGDPDLPLPGTLREQIEQLVHKNWVDGYASDTARADYMDVARLTLDAVEAEIRKWYLEDVWVSELDERMAALRAQLTVSRQPPEEECKGAAISSAICAWGTRGCDVQHKQRAYSNPTTITNAEKEHDDAGS